MNNENNTEIKDKKSDKPKQSPISEFYDYLEIFVFAACAVLLLFTFSVRLCRVDGDSMYNTLENGQMLLVSDVFYTPEQGDIIVFHQSDNTHSDLNKPLVKRVIATGGQYYKIEYVPDYNDEGLFYKMLVYVSDDENFDNSELMQDDYIDYSAAYARLGVDTGISHYKSGCVIDASTMIYTRMGQVPEGKLFVMGDNRYNSNDSRLYVGYVDARCVLGKVIFRITPPGSVY